jgi:hypothetical protein
MTDETAKTARLIKVMDEIIKELERQGVAEVLANLSSIRERWQRW